MHAAGERLRLPAFLTLIPLLPRRHRTCLRAQHPPEPHRHSPSTRTWRIQPVCISALEPNVAADFLLLAGVVATAAGGGMLLYQGRARQNSAHASPTVPAPQSAIDETVSDSPSSSSYPAPPSPLPRSAPDSDNGVPLDADRGAVLGLTVLGSHNAAGSATSAAALTAQTPLSGAFAPLPSPLADTTTAVGAPRVPGADDFLDMDGGGGGGAALSARLVEELQWAEAQVLDMGAEGVAVIDADGALVWSAGALSTGEACTGGGELVARVRRTGLPVVFDTDGGNPGLAFFADDVHNVALLPMGESGAVLAVASATPSFYSAREDRIATAVAGRLGMFLFTERFKG